MLQAAIDAEVKVFIEMHQDRRDSKGRRLVVKNGSLPAYLRRAESIEELIPWLYLKGISTNDFQEALQSLVGELAKGLSANVAVRLKEQLAEEYDQWCQHAILRRKNTLMSGQTAFTSKCV